MDGPEVHFIGEIDFGAHFETSDGLFVESHNRWRFLVDPFLGVIRPNAYIVMGPMIESFYRLI